MPLAASYSSAERFVAISKGRIPRLYNAAGLLIATRFDGDQLVAAALPMREVERLGIAKLQWSRKIDREIIAQLICARCPITIGDLPAWSGISRM